MLETIFIVILVQVPFMGMIFWYVYTVVKENNNIRAENRALHIRLDQLEKKLFIFESVNDDNPLPFWIKDPNNFKMLYCNKKYEDYFLRPYGKTSLDYIGRSDHEFWTKEEADIFLQNDSYVLKLRGVHMTKEYANGEQITVVKYPVFVNSIIVAIAGIAIVDVK
jgi:hypothetical protein